MKNKVVLYHANCTDGIVSAFIAYRLFKGSATYIPVQYNKPVPKEVFTTKYVYILDFCYPLDVLNAIADSTNQRGGKLTVIDHHESNKAILKGAKGFDVIFNTKMSGAGLSHMFFFGANKGEILRAKHECYIKDFNLSETSEAYTLYNIACLVQDRDIWKWKLKESRGFSLWFSMQDRNFRTLSNLKTLSNLVSGKTSLFGAIEKGKLLADYYTGIVDNFVSAARPITLQDTNGNSHTGLFCFCHDARFISDIGGGLAKKSGTFGCVVGFSKSDNTLLVSLRSVAKKQGEFDCIPIAQFYGGGGHRNASGCRFTPEQFQLATTVK